MDSMTIQSGQGDYEVCFVPDVREAMDRLAGGKEAFVLLDERIRLFYPEPLAGLEAFPIHAIPATEQEKTMDGVGRFLDFLQRHGANKKSTVVAVGGGIIQDIATFAAHVYYRGVAWEYYPTTLLGMADSCIGAKCGINLGLFKNQIGVFHSPRKVCICSGFLSTLSGSDILSGYGEILKLLLTGPRAQFEEFRRAVEAEGLAQAPLPLLIRQSLAVKKSVIEQDEYETDLRRILNYGHTFGHSLEAMTRHAVPHGQAVAWGVDLANYVSMRRGLLGRDDFESIHGLIRKHFHARLASGCSAHELLEGMKRDKKASSGSVSLILLRHPGRLEIVPTLLDGRLEAEVQDYLDGWNVFSWN